MRSNYPTTFDAINDWAKVNGFSPTEAQTRFAQYAILCAVGRSADLRQSIVFKGGNALDFVWSPNRSTRDLDFSLDSVTTTFSPTVENIGEYLVEGLVPTGEEFGILFHLHRVRQRPPGADRTFVTFEARVGYALSSELALRRRMAKGDSSPNVIPVEISINESTCASDSFDLGPKQHILRISTVEDIVAEKLRAILQQPIRKRTRRQDVLDIAVILSQSIPLDRAKVARFLVRKSAARDVTVSRAAFRDPEIGIRAQDDYAELEPTTRLIFIPFEEALAMLLAFVDELDIPEN